MERASQPLRTSQVSSHGGPERSGPKRGGPERDFGQAAKVSLKGCPFLWSVCLADVGVNGQRIRRKHEQWAGERHSRTRLIMYVIPK